MACRPCETSFAANWKLCPNMGAILRVQLASEVHGDIADEFASLLHTPARSKRRRKTLVSFTPKFLPPVVPMTPRPRSKGSPPSRQLPIQRLPRPPKTSLGTALGTFRKFLILSYWKQYIKNTKFLSFGSTGGNRYLLRTYSKLTLPARKFLKNLKTQTAPLGTLRTSYWFDDKEPSGRKNFLNSSSLRTQYKQPKFFKFFKSS